MDARALLELEVSQDQDARQGQATGVRHSYGGSGAESSKVGPISPRGPRTLPG